jgi:hypothetical protein
LRLQDHSKSQFKPSAPAARQVKGRLYLENVAGSRRVRQKPVAGNSRSTMEDFLMASDTLQAHDLNITSG